MAEILQGGKRDSLNTDTYIVTNTTERYTFDANTVTLAETNDALATLIRSLIRAGVINGTVA
jgi:hypothetical protein